MRAIIPGTSDARPLTAGTERARSPAPSGQAVDADGRLGPVSRAARASRDSPVPALAAAAVGAPGPGRPAPGPAP